MVGRKMGVPVKVFVVLSAVLNCNGVSLREQLALIARRFNMPKEGVILGAPSFPSHLPEAEPILPGHTLLRPALGMLKSAVKFPHRDLENGAGVYGNVDNLGLRYGSNNIRVMHSGFRRTPKDIYVVIPVPADKKSLDLSIKNNAGLRQQIQKLIRRPTKKSSSDVTRYLTVYPSKQTTIHTYPPVYDKNESDEENPSGDCGCRSPRNKSPVNASQGNKRPVNASPVNKSPGNASPGYGSPGNRPPGYEYPPVSLSKKGNSKMKKKWFPLRSQMDQDTMEKLYGKKKRNTMHNRLHTSDKTLAYVKKLLLKLKLHRQRRNQNQNLYLNIGNEKPGASMIFGNNEVSSPEVTEKLKNDWILKSQGTFNNIKLNSDAPDFEEYLPKNIGEDDLKKWWYFHQADFQPFNENNE